MVAWPEGFMFAKTRSSIFWEGGGGGGWGNGPPIRPLGSFPGCTNCHVCALFTNGHRLASNSPSSLMGVEAQYFLSQYALRTIVWRVVQVTR